MTEPAVLPRLGPFAGFPVLFAWGARRLLRARRFVVTTLLGLAAGAGLGYLAGQHTRDAAFNVWEMLDNAFLGVAVPLVALSLVGGGFGEEVQDRTLVWHLVRPVRRSTLYYARYAAGLVPGSVAAAAMVVAAAWASPVALSGAGYATLAGLAALGTATVGALYYALAAVFRRGLIAGLLYSFLFEGFFQFLPGSFQTLSLMHHVRSIYHRALDADFSAISPRVAEEIERQRDVSMPGALPGSPLLRAAKIEPWTTTPSALLICAVVIAAALFLGARAVSRKDYALKD